MSHYFNEKEIETYKECFSLYVKNSIVKNDSQLRFLMRSLGYFPTVNETKRYIENFNYNVNFPSFLEILYDNQQKSMPIEEISKALDVLDIFKDGSITVSDLATKLHTFGEKMSIEEIEGAFKEMKIKGNNIYHDILLEYVSSIN